MSNIVYYTGTGANSFDEFIMQFRQVAAINNWPESNLGLILGAYLQGPALAYFKYIYNESLDYKTICEKLKSEFPAKTDFVEKFYNTRQEANEDILGFFYTLADISNKAKITDDKIFIKIFLKAITTEYKLKLGTKVYNSKEELRSTVEQIKELFGDARLVPLNLPIQPPKGIQARVAFELPTSVRGQSTPVSVRPSSPMPSPSSRTPPHSQEHGDAEAYHTPRYNLRPRYPYVSNRNYRVPFMSSPGTSAHSPSRSAPTNHPNVRGHRR